MTPAAAVYDFMAGFGIPAYAATSVPDEAGFPYITYELAVDDFWGGEIALSMDIWYRGDSEAEPNATDSRRTRSSAITEKVRPWQPLWSLRRLKTV